jgi:hypothetical protein
MIEEFTVTACESSCNSIPKAIFLRIPVRFYPKSTVRGVEDLTRGRKRIIIML